jgi:hypothetical protein
MIRWSERRGRALVMGLLVGALTLSGCGRAAPGGGQQPPVADQPTGGPPAAAATGDAQAPTGPEMCELVTLDEVSGLFGVDAHVSTRMVGCMWEDAPDGVHLLHLYFGPEETVDGERRFDFEVRGMGTGGEQEPVVGLGDEAVLVTGASFAFSTATGVVYRIGDRVYVLVYIGREATALAIGDDLVALAHLTLERL